MRDDLTLTLTATDGSTETLSVRFVARPDGSVEVHWGDLSRDLWMPNAVTQMAAHMDFALWELTFDDDAVASWEYTLPNPDDDDEDIVVELGRHFPAILEWLRAEPATS